MYNARLLEQMIKDHDGSVLAFSKRLDNIPYTTLKTSLETNKKLGRMPIENFVAIADALDMDPNGLIKALKV